MDLLKTHRKDFRYYIFEDKNVNEIVILVTFSNTRNLEPVEETELETFYLHQWTPNKSNWIVYSCPEAENTIDKINKDIQSFIKRSTIKDVLKISIINGTHDHGIIFEPYTFKVITEKCKNIFININEYSAIRVSDYDYGQLNTVEIETGMILVDKTCTIFIDEFKANRCIFNVYNQSENNCYLNLCIGSTFKVNNLKQYSTLKVVYLNKVYDSDTFIGSIFRINCFTIFGSETLKFDSANERVYLKGFNKAVINRIVIENAVKYGVIFSIDMMSSLMIGSLERTVYEILAGSAIIINRVAKVNLNDIKISISPDGSIADNYSLCSFVPVADKSLKRSISLVDCEIHNLAKKSFYIASLINVTIDKLYFSKCQFNKDVYPFKKDDKSVITNLCFNSSSFISDKNVDISGSSKINITETDITTPKDIFISATYISLNQGIWKFNKLSMYNDNTVKFSLQRLELIGKKILIDNKDLENDITVSLSQMKIQMKDDITMNNCKCTATNNYLETKLLKVSTKESFKMLNNVLGFVDNTLDLTINGSISGTLAFKLTNSDSKLNILVNDKEKFLPTNVLDFNCGEYSPIISFELNRPIRSIIVGMSQKTNHIRYSQSYTGDQGSTIKYTKINGEECKCSLINDSEKICTIVKSIDGDELKSYKIDKI